MRFLLILAVSISVLMSDAAPTGSAVGVGESENYLKKRIEDIEKDIKNANKELEKEEKKLKSKKQEKQKILDEMDHTEKKIKAVNNNIWTIKKEGKYLENELSNHRKTYENSNERLKEHSKVYAARIKSMYKRHNISAIQVLFSTGSFSSFLWGFKMLSVMLAEDLSVLDEIRGEQNTIQQSVKKIKSTLNAKVALARVQENEKKKLSSSQKKHKSLAARLEKDEELLEARIKKHLVIMENAEKEKQKLLSDIQKKVRRTETPEVLKGYDFASNKGKLSWPVSGKVVTNFGVVVDRQTKTKITSRGIEILTQHGAAVSSIGRGQVVMINFIRGYGNFIIIYHPENYYSVYGHLSDILVNVDEIVYEKDLIGSAGSSGLLDDSEALLKLEILKNSQPENPIKWLKPDRQRVSR
ncbi:murein hydrolase activator EnvC family protein [Candidatus Latescibacterota bacterium]